MPAPHPQTPRPAGPTGFAIGRRAAIWLTGIALFVAAMTWLSLYEIKITAEDNPPSEAEIAQCIAGFDPESGVSLTEACPREAHVKWAARHPLRNAIVTFVVLMILGYDVIILNRFLQPR